MKGNQEHTISVVTVVYNGAKFIENTIKSVLCQTYPHIEYIIIDGGSTDGTVEIIKKYSHRVNYWISEPDSGVYEAMNKGIEAATGRWINFMNAGDLFYSPQSIELFFSENTDLEQYAIVYGDAEFRIKNIAYISESEDESDPGKFMPFSHQASFIRNDIAKKIKFDLTYKIAADTALSLRLLTEGYHFKKVPVVVCSYDASQGLSVHNEVARAKELIEMQAVYNHIDPEHPEFKRFLKDACMKQRLRKAIPNFIWLKIRENSIKKKYSKYRTIK